MLLQFTFSFPDVLMTTAPDIWLFRFLPDALMLSCMPRVSPIRCPCCPVLTFSSPLFLTAPEIRWLYICFQIIHMLPTSPHSCKEHCSIEQWGMLGRTLGRQPAWRRSNLRTRTSRSELIVALNFAIMSLANKPLVELRIEDDRTAQHRTVVACEDLVLHNLHRIAQHCFKPVSGPGR